MYQVPKTVSQSVQPALAPHPLSVEQSTQTEEPYPEPIKDHINRIKRILLERQRTTNDHFIEKLIKLYDNMAGCSNVECIKNRFEEFSREYLECEEENRDDEVINENEEDVDIVSHDESYSNEEMDDSEVIGENEEDADSVSNDENYDGYNSHSEDDTGDIAEEEAQYRGLF